MGVPEVLSAIALIVAALGYYENRRSNNIQLRQAIALEESNQIARKGEVQAVVPPNAATAFEPSRWPAAVLLVLLLMNVAVTAFDYHKRSSITEHDPRLLPLNDPEFFAGLSVDPKQSVMMVCFPYDPLSCNIAAQYRDRFADYWTPETTGFNVLNPAPKGVVIITKSESGRPAGALALRQRFRAIGVSADLDFDPSIKDPSEFQVVIGGRP